MAVRWETHLVFVPGSWNRALKALGTSWVTRVSGMKMGWLWAEGSSERPSQIRGPVLDLQAREGAGNWVPSPMAWDLTNRAHVMKPPWKPLKDRSRELLSCDGVPTAGAGAPRHSLLPTRPYTPLPFGYYNKLVTVSAFPSSVSRIIALEVGGGSGEAMTVASQAGMWVAWAP